MTQHVHRHSSHSQPQQSGELTPSVSHVRELRTTLLPADCSARFDLCLCMHWSVVTFLCSCLEQKSWKLWLDDHSVKLMAAVLLSTL